MNRPRLFFPSVTILLGLLVLISSLPVFAIQPVPQNDSYEIGLPQFMPLAQAKIAFARQGNLSTASLRANYGGNWQVFSHNQYTGTPHYVYGGSEPLGTSLRSTDQVVSAAHRVLVENPDLFQANLDDLRVKAVPHAAGKWVVHYQQIYHGLDVWEGKAIVAFSDAGGLMLAGSDFYSDIKVNPIPGMDSAMAEMIARNSVPFDPSRDHLDGQTDLLVLPVPVTPTEVEHHLVYRVRVNTSNPLGIWVTHVDAHSGEIVWRYNDIHFDHEGSASSLVQEDTYCNGATDQASPYLRVTGDGVGQTITDADGNWIFEGSTGTLNISADLYGPYIDMNNFGGVEGEYNGVAEEGEPASIQFNPFNSQQDERDTFDAINDIHDFFETIDPGFGYSQARISAYVSRDDGYCPGNAWWNGTINFCVAGDGYENTGEIQGVVHHEFGHGVQDFILGWQGNQGLGEGNGDILACILTQDPALGRGFFEGNCDDGLRNAENSLTYPGDVVGQPIHAAGQVILGFTWDAMILMQNYLGEDEGTRISASNWHFGRTLLQPTSQPDQVFATFFADDDDGNLDNGTPNHAFYCEAAGNHNFDCPEILVGVLFSHTPLYDTTDSTNPYPVAAEIWSTEADLVLSSVLLHWRINGGTWNEQVLTEGQDNAFAGEIPAQSPGDIEYYLSAADGLGNTATLPALAPDTLFNFLVATSIDPVEVYGEWISGAAGDDATSGVWELVNPLGTSAQPDDDHTVDGAVCWVTGQHIDGQGDGYNDVDGGATTLFSPVYDLSGYNEVSLRYWKWYSNNMGNSPNLDFWDVSLSNDGGDNWVAIEHTTQSTNAWVGYTVNVLDYFQEVGQVQLRFVASDEGEGSLVEAAIDDLAIVAFSGVAGVEDDLLQVQVVTELGRNHPNPFNPRTRIDFSLAKPGRATLQVYDVSGRLVKTLLQGSFPAGDQSVMWDGTTSGGRSVATGVYFYRLETDDRVMSRRMMLLK